MHLRRQTLCAAHDFCRVRSRSPYLSPLHNGGDPIQLAKGNQLQQLVAVAVAVVVAIVVVMVVVEEEVVVVLVVLVLVVTMVVALEQ